MQNDVLIEKHNSINFKKVYMEIVTECVKRRQTAKFTQKFIAEWLKVDVRKIIELEKGNGGVGLLLNYSDLLDIEVKLNFKNW